MTSLKTVFLFVALAASGALVASLLTGCSLGAKAPESDAGFYQINKMTYVCDPVTGHCTLSSLQSTAKGPSASGEGVKGFKASPISIDADGNISGGGMSFALMGGGFENKIAIYAGCGIALLSLLLAGWIGHNWLVAGIGMAFGFCVIGLAFYPQIAVGVAIVLGLIGLVVVIHAMREKYMSTQTANSLTDTVQMLKRVAEEKGVAQEDISDIMQTTQSTMVQKRVLDIKKKKKIGIKSNPVSSAYAR